MAKCCDRCKKPIDLRDMAIIKFKFNWREFVKDIEVAIFRNKQGINDPSYYHKTVNGKLESCEECSNKLTEFMIYQNIN